MGDNYYQRDVEKALEYFKKSLEKGGKEAKWYLVVLKGVDDWNDEETEDEVKDHESAGGHVAPTVPWRADLRVGRVAVLLVADRQPRLGPTGRGANLKLHRGSFVSS